MNRYLIESNHTDEECLRALDMIMAYGHITHFEWGCEAGTHSGWAIVEAESDQEAILMLPPLLRNVSRVVRLRKYTPEMIKKFHEKEG